MSIANIIQSEHQNWQPISPAVIKNEHWQKEVHQNGYLVTPLLSADQLKRLKSIYDKHHNLKSERGGMFYSLYSSDFAYRQKVHNEIQQVLKPTLDQHLQNYKVVVNTFVVKASGPQSEFYVHQDTTALDEDKYTAISWWIPLQDTDLSNGALCIVEKTHWFFSPLRSVSFPFAFHKIIDTIRSYLKPLIMRKGEVLIFDPRIVHNSLPNLSGKDRVVIVCGIFPEEAEFITCWKDPTYENSPIEHFRHSDDYTLRYPNFLHNCHDRPVSGEKIGETHFSFPDMSRSEFEELCHLNKIEKGHLPDSSSTDLECNMIAEPDSQEDVAKESEQTLNGKPSKVQRLTQLLRGLLSRTNQK